MKAAMGFDARVMKLVPIVLASVLLSSACGGDGGPDLVGAPGVTIEEIAIYQGVKRSLFGGDDGQDIPIISGKEALVRVFATGNEQYNREPVLARLTLATRDGESIVFEEPIRSLPLRLDEPSLDSTINFWLPGDVVTPEMNYRLELLQDATTADGDNPNAAYPVEDNLLLPLGAVAAPQPLEIVLVPVKNNGLEPDVSAEQVERYRQGFLDRYPTTEIKITVRDTYTFESPITAGGNGWDTLLDELATLRSTDNAEPQVYYYGIFTPMKDFYQYCTGGCILGLGYVGGASDSFMRAAIGLGYTGLESMETAVHEVGHNHGREHAPCGVDYADPAYPHENAGIGTWGLAYSTRELKSPYTVTDFMGYCEDTWVSDYTYKALYDRIRAVDSQRRTAPRTFGRVRIGAGGEATPLSPITVDSPLSLERRFTAVGDDGQTVEGEAHFVPYDHIEGGILLVPERFSGLQITSVSGLALDR